MSMARGGWLDPDYGSGWRCSAVGVPGSLVVSLVDHLVRTAELGSWGAINVGIFGVYLKTSGSVGRTNGTVLWMVSYSSSERTKARYPNWPPPRVVGTLCALILSCLKRCKRVFNVGSLCILSNVWYCKCVVLSCYRIIVLHFGRDNDFVFVVTNSLVMQM